MAVINYYDNILEGVSHTETIDEKCKLKALVENYINKKEDDSQLVEIYHADTDTTEYQLIKPDSYKVICIINGNEVPLCTEVEKDDVVTIIFAPQKKNFWLGAAGVALAIGGAILIAASGGAFTGPGAWMMYAGLGLMVGGSLLLGLAIRPEEDQSVSYDNNNDNTNLPYIAGAENEDLLNNRYPYIMGKHLLSPRIAGSPYHVTKTKNRAKAEDLGQEVHVLYCAGYGPLRITDIKMGEEILAYNRSSASGDRKTVYHGQLSGCDNPEKGIIGDLPVKWKNNDIKIDILQAGSKSESIIGNKIDNKYGTIYPRVVLEKKINANCLFVYDKIINEVAGEKYSRVYYNRAIPVGYRNNGVRYSSSCPMKMEVELDFTNGLFATRQEKNGDAFQTRYRNIPMNVAVQWRFTGRNTDASDAESPDGWKNFSFIEFEQEQVPPETYTLKDIEQEIIRNKGLTPGIQTIDYPNVKWVGSKVFKLTQGSYDTPYATQDFNTVERRYVISYTFTEEECRKLAGFDTTEDILDVVEVRVIRITPCYLNQESADDSENNTAMNYQDLFKWTYLRTFTFDKVKYLQALKEASDLSDVNVSDYIERPQPIETDMDKFCYIGLQATEDAAGTIGGSIKKLSLIAESFNPKYDSIEKKWYPQDIWEDYKYYKKYKAGDEYKTKEITRSEYEAGVVEDQDNFIKQAKGNDFVEQIRDEIFVDKNIVKDSEGQKIVSPFVKYSIPEETAMKYISSNTASQFVNAIVGPQLGIDSRTYDCIQMDSTTDFYEFCEDVTDGTEEIYTGINSKLETTIDFTNKNRIHSPDEFISAGYTDFNKKYETTNSQLWTKDDGTETVVVTMVRNSRTQDKNGIITREDFDSDTETSLKSRYRRGDSSFNNSIVLAKFTGGNQIVSAKRYAQVYHMMNSAYMEPNLYQPNVDEYLQEAKKCLDVLKDVPINAIRSGIKSDIIKKLNIVLCKRESIDVDPIFESYIIDILEQTVQSNQTTSLCSPSDNLQHVKFECNGVIVKDTKLENLLQKILVTGRASLKRSDENKFEPLIGRPNPYPVTILNQRTCISKSNVRSYQEPPSGFLVSCIDEDDNYSQNDFYVMAKGEDYRNPLSRIEPFNLEYVTNKWQLASLARFNLACRLYQLETYTRTIGIMGYAVSFGDTVLLQDDTLLIGTDKGGRIVELLEDKDFIYGFVTDEPFHYTGQIKNDISVQGCTVVQPQKIGASRCVTYRFAAPEQEVVCNGKIYKMTVGLTNLCLFNIPVQKDPELDSDTTADIVVYQPKIDSIVAFGLVDSITTKAIIMGIKPNDKEQFTLTLVPYNEDLYHCGFGQPVFKSNMTTSVLEDNFEFNDNVTKRTIADEVDNFAGGAINEIKSELHVSEKPDPFTVFASAKETGLNLAISIGDTSTLNNSIQSIEWQILSYLGEGIPNNETLEENLTVIDTFTTSLTEYEYLFNRKKIGYPEKDSDTSVIIGEETVVIPRLDSWYVRAKATNVYGETSDDWSELAKVNVDSYGTWTIAEPEVSIKVNDRTVSLSCSQPSGSIIRYGNVQYKIQVRRAQGEEDDPWDSDLKYYKPDLFSNPYTEINGYKVQKGMDTEGNPIFDTGYVIVSSVHLQVMPLWGQGTTEEEKTNSIKNTPYEFMVTAFNESGNQTAIHEPAKALALCTSIRDIVQANLDVKTQYVQTLTALCSAFGFVSSGLETSEQRKNPRNYWTLNDKVIDWDNEKGDHINREGSFRIGGDKQYLQVKPIVDEDGNVIEDENGNVKDYELELKIGNFTLTSTTTAFNTNLYIYDEALPTRKRLKVTSTGLILETSNDDKNPYAKDKKWIETAVIVADSNGNLTITNDWQDESLPSEKILVEKGTIIYHLEDNTQDNFGGNTAMFNFEPNGGNNGFVNSSLIEKAFKAYKGTISKEMEAENILLFNNSNKIRIGNDLIDTESLSIDSTCEELNTILGTTAFRWEM